MKTDYVQVYLAQGMPEALMIQTILESFEIPVLINQESAGIAYGLTVGPLGQAKISVPLEQEKEANEVIRNYLLDQENGNDIEDYSDSNSD